MRSLIPALICLFFTVHWGSRIIIVDDDGPADFNNIQAAINAAGNGNIIVVSPGTYAGEFTGGRVAVPDACELRPKHQVSASARVYYSENQDYDARIVVKGPDNMETYAIEIGENDNLNFYVRDANSNRFDVGDDGDVRQNEWLHLAGTYDGNSVKCYVNGQLEGSKDANFVERGIPLSQDTNDLAIGNRSDATNRAYMGTVDEVCVYNYALSQAEVAWLASDGSGVIPLMSPANLFLDDPDMEVIDFKDFAEMMQQWGDRGFWPPEPE